MPIAPTDFNLVPIGSTVHVCHHHYHHHRVWGTHIANTDLEPEDPKEYCLVKNMAGHGEHQLHLIPQSNIECMPNLRRLKLTHSHLRARTLNFLSRKNLRF